MTRLPVGLEAAGGWKDTLVQLPPGTYTDRLSGKRHDGGRVEAEEVFEHYPVALLVRQEES